MRVIHYGADASIKEELYTDRQGVLSVVEEILSRLDTEEWIEIEKVVEPDDSTVS